MKKNTIPFGEDIFYQDTPLGIPKRKKFFWVEESFVFDKSFGKQVANIQSNEYLGSSFTKKAKWIFFGIFVFCYSILFSRIIYLQIFQGENALAKAQGNRERIIPLAAERGLIFDRNGIELTKNIPSFSLVLIPQDLPRSTEEREAVIQKLSIITSQDASIIREILKEYGSYSYESLVIQEDIDYNTALLLQIQSSDLPGISIQRGSKRLYMMGETTAHVLGYEGKLNKSELDTLYTKGYLPSDSIGKTGLEKYYESELRGIYGKQKIEVNALGKEQSVISQQAPLPGKHLTLSIDSTMQDQLQKIMKAEMEKIGQTKGAAVVVNPKNGEVLALVSLPSFDNNDFSGGISKEKYAVYSQNSDGPLFNRVFGGNYPSGSTIKPVIAAAALQEKVIQPSTSFLSSGGLRVGSSFFPDWQSGGHGITDVRKSLAQSVNTFYYYIGGGFENFDGLGIDRISNYLKKFYFSSTLGIDLPGEIQGFVPTREWKEQEKKEKWYVGDTYNVSIGQGDLLVTPLQIAQMTSIFANFGTLYKPHVVKTIVDPVSKQKEEIQPIVLSKNLVDSSVISTIRLGMKDCVEYGSCRRLASLPFTSAGKTGTAQWNKNKPNHAWFTSFAPFENPEIVITVLVEQGEEGSRVAVPIVHEFYKWWATYR